MARIGFHVGRETEYNPTTTIQYSIDTVLYTFTLHLSRTVGRRRRGTTHGSFVCPCFFLFAPTRVPSGTCKSRNHEIEIDGRDPASAMRVPPPRVPWLSQMGTGLRRQCMSMGGGLQLPLPKIRGRSQPIYRVFINIMIAGSSYTEWYIAILYLIHGTVEQ